SAARKPRRPLTLNLELLEDRVQPSAGVFLQGTAFVDVNNNHVLDNSDQYLPGATVSLYQGTTATGTPLATVTTRAYLFSAANVPTSYGTPGPYPRVETPPPATATPPPRSSRN